MLNYRHSCISAVVFAVGCGLVDSLRQYQTVWQIGRLIKTCSESIADSCYLFLMVIIVRGHKVIISF